MYKSSVKMNSVTEAGGGAGTSPAVAASASSSRSGGGKITHDSRGNAIWEWGVATGVFARIKTNELLNMLENPTLALEGECQLAAGEWSGDPYNRR
jgi:hypothetical protein